MKVKNENELWIHNPGKADVSISDLGVKVPAGKAVNVYKYNPYLTVSKVEDSRTSGALFRRLESKVLKIVTKATNPIPKTLNQIKASNKTVQAKKTKTSVVIETKLDEPEEDGNFNFADYGIVTGPDVDAKKEGNSVFVHAKKDDMTEPDKGSSLEPVVESGINNQSQVIMKHMQESMTDPMGPIAPASKPTASHPFTVVSPPKDPEPTKTPEGVTPTGESIMKDESGAIVVGAEKKPRSIKTVKKAQEEDTDDYTLPGDDEDGADEVIDFEDTEFDTKAAVKTEDGSVVMQIKEDEEE